MITHRHHHGEDCPICEEAAEYAADRAATEPEIRRLENRYEARLWGDQ